MTDEDEDRVESLATFVISNPHLPDTPVMHVSDAFCPRLPGAVKRR